MTTTKTLMTGAIALVAMSGCIFWGPESEPPRRTEPAPAPTPVSRVAPRIESIAIPEWPPIGKKDLVRVTVADERGGGSVEASFARGIRKPFSGSRAEVTFSGEELGEGLGLLRIVAESRDGVRLEKRVENLLVDLTPPLVDLEREAVARDGAGRDGEIALSVRDAWVLGSVELTFGGKTFRHDLPKAYPATLGRTWDITRVTFPARDFPEGRGNAVVVATDAAGNRTLVEVPLRIDGTLPEAAILSPANDSEVDGPFDVMISAKDLDATAPARIDVRIGGAPAVTLLGPDATLRVDPATLSKGKVVVEAIAIDEAGNRSRPANVVLDVR